MLIKAPNYIKSNFSRTLHRDSFSTKPKRWIKGRNEGVVLASSKDSQILCGEGSAILCHTGIAL